METNYEHLVALEGIDQKTLPKDIRGKINKFIQLQKKVEGSNPVDPKKQRELVAYSAVIANDIQDWVERDYPEAKEDAFSAKPGTLNADETPAQEPEPEVTFTESVPETVVSTVVVKSTEKPVSKSVISTIFGKK